MSDKKLPKIKHNHTLTDILKASIFSLVMMAPVAAIGVTCAYVVCNKNAYQSYSGSQFNTIQYEQLDVKDEIPLNNVMNFNSATYNYTGSVPIGAYAHRWVIKDVKNVKTNYSNYIINETNFNEFGLYLTSSNASIQLFYNNVALGNAINLNANYLTFDFTFVSGNASFNYFSTNMFSKLSFENAQPLDNVFYYAVDTMQNNTLFSWTKTTAIYTPVNAMTTGMGINTPAIAVLLVYWLLCTAVYIIIDIVVKGFTWLTHLIGER